MASWLKGGCSMELDCPIGSAIVTAALEFKNMPRALEVKALTNFRIQLRYDDGASGIVDLSDIAGQGVFSAWHRPGVFASVRLGAHGELIWNDELDICPDAMYMRLTHKTPEQVFPNLARITSDA